MSHIVVLAQFATRATDAFERQSDKMIKFLLKQVIMAELPIDEVNSSLSMAGFVRTYLVLQDAMNVEEEWIEDSQMSPDLRAKLFAVKACRNRCLAHAGSSDEMEIAKPVLRMLITLLQHGGSLSADATDECVYFCVSTVYPLNPLFSPKSKARLRLQAAVSLLHLASVPKFAEVITPNFILLAITMQVCAWMSVFAG